MTPRTTFKLTPLSRIGLGLGALGLLVILFSQSQPAKAAQDLMHMADILFRVDSEIMTQTPATRYYREMYWSHNAELCEIVINHSEQRRIFIELSEVFVPPLEALVNGQGDTVTITAEQVAALEAGLKSFAEVGRPALQNDIAKELQRWRLSDFIGLTMSGALDYINLHWSATP